MSATTAAPTASASATAAPPRVETALQHDANAASDDEMTVEEVHAAMPNEKQPTIAFIIPFPAYLKQLATTEEESEKAKKATIPPFLIYHPPKARLQKPAEGQKESKVDKAIRKWQEEEDEARGKTGIKAKAVGVSTMFPPFV